MDNYFDQVASVIGFDPRKLDEGPLVESQYVHRRGVETRLAELMSLPAGWDGYRGLPVAPCVADKVHAVLARCLSPKGRYPSLVPGADGDVQIEWHWGGVDLEVGLNASAAVHVWLATSTLPEGRETDFHVLW